MSAPPGYVDSIFDDPVVVPLAPKARGNGAPAEDQLVFGDLSEVTIRPIVFADKPLLQQATFHVLAGRKGVGKGTYMAYVAARVTRGELGPNRRVIWVALGEDSYAMDVHPRILAAEGDPMLVRDVRAGRMRLPEDVPVLSAEARRLGDVGLVVIDPLGGGLGGGKSSNHDNDVRPAISPLNNLADELNCVVIGVRHITNKQVTGGSLAGILGSSDWVNVPRCVIAIERDKTEDTVRHIQAVGGNRAAGSAALSFRITGKSVVEGGEPVTCAVDFGASSESVDELLSSNGSGSRRITGDEKEALQQLVREALATGGKNREYLNRLAKDELNATPNQIYDHAITPLREAKEIRAFKDGMSGGWSYELR